MSAHNVPATDSQPWYIAEHPICLFEVVPRSKCESSRPGSQPPHHQSAESMLENARVTLSHRHTAFTKSNRQSGSQPENQETYTLFYFIQATPPQHPTLHLRHPYNIATTTATHWLKCLSLRPSNLQVPIPHRVSLRNVQTVHLDLMRPPEFSACQSPDLK